MKKPAVLPLTAGLVAKGSAAPVAATSRPEQAPAAAPVPAPDIAPAEQPAAPRRTGRPPADEQAVHHNFKVPKSFKRRFDQAAFDAEMSNVKFIQHIFAFYQKHHK